MTTEDFDLVCYRRADRARVFAFLREAHARADSERLIRQWDWKYEANPFNRNGEPFILLLMHGGRIAGMYGGIFLRCVIDGHEYVAHHGCDLVVHPAYRGQRLSARLRRRDKDRPLHFSWQNEISYRVSRPDGTHGVPFVSVIKPLDAARVTRSLLGDQWLGRAVGAVTAGVLRWVPALPHRPVLPEVTVTRLDTFDARFDRLWQRACRTHRVMLVRDRRYLDWRFTQRPDAQYTIWAAIRQDDLLGYLVTRCASRAGERWGYLVDFLVAERSPAVFELLLERAIADLREAGAAAVSCRAAAPAYRRLLYWHGFVRSWREARGYLRTRIDLPDPGLQVFADPRQWFVTMGDGDLEMSI